MRARLVLAVVPLALLALAGCAPGSSDGAQPTASPTDGASPSSPSSPPSPSTPPPSPSPSVASTPSPSPAQPSAPADAALPAAPTSCADLDSPEAAALAEGTGYEPSARPLDPFAWDELPVPALSCAWAPAGGSDSFAVVAVYDVDVATIEALEASHDWGVQQTGSHTLRTLGESTGDGRGSERAWAVAEGRLVQVTATQTDEGYGLALAEIVVPALLG